MRKLVRARLEIVRTLNYTDVYMYYGHNPGGFDVHTWEITIHGLVTVYKGHHAPQTCGTPPSTPVFTSGDDLELVAQYHGYPFHVQYWYDEVDDHVITVDGKDLGHVQE